jgi:hypothetical protein
MISLLKAAEWERAKGSLRAVASLAGQHTYSDNQTDRWRKIDAAVEDFISRFEGEGFQE